LKTSFEIMKLEHLAGFLLGLPVSVWKIFNRF